MQVTCILTLEIWVYYLSQNHSFTIKLTRQEIKTVNFKNRYSFYLLRKSQKFGSSHDRLVVVGRQLLILCSSKQSYIHIYLKWGRNSIQTDIYRDQFSRKHPNLFEVNQQHPISQNQKRISINTKTHTCPKDPWDETFLDGHLENCIICMCERREREIPSHQSQYHIISHFGEKKKKSKKRPCEC